MIQQTYQGVSNVIIKDLKGLSRLRISNIDKIPLNGKKADYHDYFYYRKTKHPKKYERLFFDTNGHCPISKDLGSIILDFKMAGFLDFENNILIDRVNEYLDAKQ